MSFRENTAIPTIAKLANRSAADIWLLCLLGFLMLATLPGCTGWSVTDPPGSLGRWKAQPGQQRILRTLAVHEELELQDFPYAEDVTPEDLIGLAEDYVIGPGDVVDVQIFELMLPGEPYFERIQVNDLGYIVIQHIGQIKADGLTASQLTERIKEELYPNILRDPEVGVVVAGRTQRTFAIVGAVREPLRYPIDKPQYRLLDALAQAQDISQLNIPYIYVIRQDKTRPAEAEAPGVAEREAPPAEAIKSGPPELSPEEQLEKLLESIPGKITPSPPPQMSSTVHLSSVSGTAGSRYTFPKLDSNKRKPAEKKRPFYWPAAKPTPKLPFAGRVIRIPLSELRAGNANCNMIVRKDDVIHVPLVDAGFYYVMGNANRPGTYNIANIPVTLTRAIAAAGGLNPVAAPAKVDIIRRIGENRQQIVQVDLGKIFAGLQPDYYIKKDDIINVGTAPASPWLAVIRNGFRATYGFGFVYDRNYADRDAGRPFELPNLLSFW